MPTVSRCGYVSMVMVCLAALAMPAVALADTSAAIDFEGLSEGQIVATVSSGSGISGDPIPGSVAVFGDSADPAITSNAAMIFDATCTPSCTGGDRDLEFPEQGNILIISEDLDSGDPDDSDLAGGVLTFDFSGFGPGQVTVESLVAMDLGDDRNEPDAGTIELFSGGSLLASMAIPEMGNNQKATVSVGVSGVDFLRITLGGSGAIDDLRISVPEDQRGAEGCTPGFWKTHPDAWEDFSPTDDFDQVFGVNAFQPDVTLMDALWLKGGGLARLARHGTAALLNAAHSQVDYPLTVSEVIAEVAAAISAGDLQGTADRLEDFNESTCDVEAGPARPRTRRGR